MNSPLPKQTATITLDGEEVAFTEGETIYEVAERHRKQVPTLCYDPRLEAFGGCRLCIVELEGARNPVASCTTQATPGMVVRTTTDEIEKYRKTLLEMVSSENRELDVDSLRGYASQELTTLVNRYEARHRTIYRRTIRDEQYRRQKSIYPARLRSLHLLLQVRPRLRRARRRLRNQRHEPRLPHTDHHRIQWRAERFSMHLLRSVCADLSNRCPRRQEGDARSRDAGRNRENPHHLPLLRCRLLNRSPDQTR